MYWILLVVCFVGVMAQDRPLMQTCSQVMRGGLQCCKTTYPRMWYKGDVKECFQVPRKPPPSCEIDICIAKKMGIMGDDEKFNKVALEAEVDKRIENNPELAASIKATCINGDVSKYGWPKMCDVMKMFTCYDVELIKNCKEWSNEGDCNGMKDLAEQCIKEAS